MLKPPSIPLLVDAIASDFGLHPKLCGEIECYLTGLPRAGAEAVFQRVSKELDTQGIGLFGIYTEEGENQYEVALKPAGPARAVEEILILKALVEDAAEAEGGAALFVSKPFESGPGCGLHIHVHVEDASGNRMLAKHEEEINEAMRGALGGLLATMPACMPWFVPDEAAFARFSDEMHVPTTLSWGVNNRTAALRLSGHLTSLKHIEHRVSGADASPSAVIAGILLGLHYGLAHEPDPGQQSHGIASRGSAHLGKLPITMADALAAQEASEIVKDYCERFSC